MCFVSVIFYDSLEQTNSSLNTTEHVYGSSVQVTCDAGYRLDEITGSCQAIFTCNEKGNGTATK